MALRSITNVSYYPAMETDNAALNRYFNDNVPVEKEKTTRIREEVLPALDAILDYVHSRDQHFGKTAVRVGSSTQGLSVNTKGDVDYSVVFELNPNEDEDHPSNRLEWKFTGRSRYYGFNDPTKNDTSSLSEGLKIVETQHSLPFPETGYHWIGGFTGFDSCYSGLAHFAFKADLIPFLVKRKFRHLLLEATKRFGLKDDLKLSRIIHGPALTFQAEVQTSDGEVHPVSIDLAVVIRARLPFLKEMCWPVPGKLWPPQDKIQSIQKMGINVVAKKSLYWQQSFAELEKELVREIDKDGGCRKDVHRIMKSVYYTVCKEDAALSSYMLKNAWFLEMEKHPDPESWQQENLAKRYFGCLQSLSEYIANGNLPQYFDRRINLLKKDKILDIQKDVDKIRNFSFGQRKRPANDSLPYHPLKKFNGAAPNWR